MIQAQSYLRYILKKGNLNLMKKSQTGQRYYQAFDVTPYLQTGLTKHEILELKDAFDLLDSNSSGKLQLSQLKSLVKAYCHDKQSQSLQLAVEQLEDSKKGVDFSSFVAVFTAFYHKDSKRQNYKKIFKIFDDEKMGCISAKNLRRVVRELDLQIDESQIQQMIQRADLNNDGVITEDEFELIMTKISSKV